MPPLSREVAFIMIFGNLYQFFFVLFNVLFNFILAKEGSSFPFYPWSPNALGGVGLGGNTCTGKLACIPPA